MKIHNFRLFGIRCFEDTGDIPADPKCNIFVGKNNAGKSTLLKAIIGLQSYPFDGIDVRRAPLGRSFFSVRLIGIRPGDYLESDWNRIKGSVRASYIYNGDLPPYSDDSHVRATTNKSLFAPTRPHHTIVPFLAKRKAVQFSNDVSLSSQSSLDGTLATLYSRIDLLATAGHPDHNRFLAAANQIIGLPITTRASTTGKVAGYYFDRDTFVTLDRMGDGVSEMAALIVELCTERNKIFVLEEPETNLHPRGLKALMAMVREASEHNQFFIATHSNVVVRELGGVNGGKVVTAQVVCG